MLEHRKNTEPLLGLLSSIVSRVVLHFDHEEREGARVTSAFREVIIY